MKKSIYLFVALWYTFTWGNLMWSKLNDNFPNPLDMPLWAQILITVLPIFLIAVNYILNRKPKRDVKRLDLVKIKGIDRPLLNLGRISINTYKLVDGDGEAFNHTGEVKFFGDIEEINNRYKFLPNQRNIEPKDFLDERGVIIFYHLFLRWYNDTFGGNPPKDFNF